jgi:hypothetical protein
MRPALLTSRNLAQEPGDKCHDQEPCEEPSECAFTVIVGYGISSAVRHGIPPLSP